MRNLSTPAAVAAVALAWTTAMTWAQPQQAKSGVAVLKNVTVINGTGAPARRVDVVIDGEQILRLTGPGAQPPDGAVVHDLSGRFVIPGLIESHVHLMQTYRISRERMFEELERLLYSGVVLAREMAGDTRVTAEAARAVLAGRAVGPELRYAAVMAGPNFFTDDPRARPAALGLRPGEAAWSQAITSETDVRLVVARAHGTHATGLKLYVQLDDDLVRRIADEAHRQGLKVWSHATVYPARPLALVRGGVDAISHACGLAWQAAALDPTRFARPNMNDRPRFDPALVDPDAREFRELFTEMIRRGTLFEPTLALHLRPGDDEFGCTSDLMTGLTRAAHRAAVPLVAGTDFVATDSDPFPSLHLELEALVEHAGLSPTEAITAATRHAARALGIEATHGTVTPGKLANLVVLREDPTRSIRALRTVETVIARGRMYSRADFRASPSVGPSSSSPPAR